MYLIFYLINNFDKFNLMPETLSQSGTGQEQTNMRKDMFGTFLK